MASPSEVPSELLEHFVKCREEYDRALERLNAFTRPAEGVFPATWLPNSTGGPSRVQPEVNVISSDEHVSNGVDSDEEDSDEEDSEGTESEGTDSEGTDSDEEEDTQDPRHSEQQQQAGPSRIPLTLFKHVSRSHEEDHRTLASCQSTHRSSPAEKIISERLLCENSMDVLLDLIRHPGGGIAPAASACFAGYIEKNPAVRIKIFSGQAAFDEVRQDMLAKLTRADTAFSKDPILKEWNEQWQKVDKSYPRYPEYYFLIARLFVYAFSIDRNKFCHDIGTKHPDSHIWSWCREAWVPRHRVKHCWECKNCFDNSWHCEKCGVCKTGSDFSCDGCGGYAFASWRAGRTDGKAIDAAPDTSDSPAGAGSSKKRPRRQTLGNEDVTETFVEAPQDVMTCTCNCKNRCSTRRCTCRKWGGRCKEGCKCRKDKAVEESLGPECHNPFEDVTRKFFGVYHPNVRASDCFVSFVERKLKKGQHCDPSEMAKTLLNADDGIVWDPEMNDIAPNLSGCRERLADLPSGSVERKEHMQLLFRGALGEGDVYEEDGIGMYKWNFCESQWYDENGPFTHCPTCGKCVADDEQWHCGVCRRCRYNRRTPCEKCGGISRSLKEHKEAQKKRLVDEKRRKEKKRQNRDMSREEKEQLRRNWKRQVSEERARREGRR
ncbi:uncharacterized protein MYCGRDRAFT_97389 [Zymoseptoria tritici IPO323]|uniref:Tesmin/TSO1-like CXC domain-containing protein n=1 Tax=Zymoseptoria tritici (strain CBS 115943 / IPO323) TaxID=336722 RepID=F9XQ25_ZYMTI|nr:uncharacterized protein MYCGRDRAFT_97389 [Zymoseptoria tritici IPO323]EGP82728.1 hypothetical protein MYCGRDRAFT_97389 [Zymoseptoria tritici IPO323]